VAGCVVATAQTPSTQSTSGGNTITVTGCLHDGSSSGSAATGTSGSTSATPAAGSMSAGNYVLMNATTGSGSASSSTTTAGTTGTTAAEPSSAASKMGTSYSLEGHEADLKNHVGHKIEITGTTDSAMKSGSTSSTSTASGTSTSSSSMSSGPVLKVTSVRMIASSCDAR